MVKKIIKHSGKDLEIKHDLSKPTIPTSLFLNCDKAKKLLGWKPSVDIDSGITKTINWYKNNII